MAEILELEKHRRKLAAKKGFLAWARRFAEPFGGETCLKDLSDKTLEVLIRGGEESTMLLYDFIMGIKGLGGGPRFHHLENNEKMAVMDVTLFLLDQLRFQAMHRLGWIDDHPTFHIPLVELADGASTRFATLRGSVPQLFSGHPLYEEYRNAFEGDRSSVVRKLIPAAIVAFQDKTGNR